MRANGRAGALRRTAARHWCCVARTSGSGAARGCGATPHSASSSGWPSAVAACSSGSAETLTVRWLETVTAGSTTRKARIKADAGTGAVAYASNYPATILVEDIGPNGTAA